MPKLRLVTWNVNGLRSVLSKGFGDFVMSTQPEMICLQEVKAEPGQADLAELGPYEILWNPAEKKGYSGTLMLTKKVPDAFQFGIGDPEHDREGRVITADFGTFFLVNVYTPNAQRDLTRLEYRLRWDAAFRSHLAKLQVQKPVIFCGDLNVAHKEIDLANPRSNRRNAGFTDEERDSFSTTLSGGFVDVFRKLDPSPHKYSWWTYRGDARQKNIGWRLDYFCATEAFAEQVIRCEIMAGIMGSDHCPVLLDTGI